MPSPNKSALYKAVERDPELRMHKKFSQGGGGGAHTGMIRWWGLQGVCANMSMDFHRAVSQGVHQQWLGHTFTPAVKRIQGASEFAIRFETLQTFPLESVKEDPMFSATRGENADISTFTTPTGTATHLYPQDSLPALAQIASLVHEHLNTKSDRSSLNALTESLYGERNERIPNVFNRLETDPSVLSQEDLHFTLQINFKKPAFSHAVAITKNPDNPDRIFILDPNVGIIETPNTSESLHKGLDTLVKKTYPEPTFEIDSYNIGLQLPHWFAKRDAVITPQEVRELQKKERDLFGKKGMLFTTDKTHYAKIFEKMLAEKQRQEGPALKTKTIKLEDDDEWDLLVDETVPDRNETQHDLDIELDTDDDQHPEDEWTLLELEPKGQAGAQQVDIDHMPPGQEQLDDIVADDLAPPPPEDEEDEEDEWTLIDVSKGPNK